MKRELREIGVDPTKLSAIFVTHDHSDHICGLEALATTFSLPVYASEAVCSAFAHARYLKGGLLDYLRPMKVGSEMKVGAMAIRSLEVPHDATQNVGYRITGPAGVFSLLTDVGELTAAIEETIRESNYLVIESNYDDAMLECGSYSDFLKDRISGSCGHISNRQAAQTVAANMHPGLRFLALCHLSGNNNTPELALLEMSNALRSVGRNPERDIRLEVLGRRVVSPEYRLL